MILYKKPRGESFKDILTSDCPDFKINSEKNLSFYFSMANVRGYNKSQVVDNKTKENYYLKNLIINHSFYKSWDFKENNNYSRFLRLEFNDNNLFDGVFKAFVFKSQGLYYFNLGNKFDGNHTKKDILYPFYGSAGDLIHFNYNGETIDKDYKGKIGDIDNNDLIIFINNIDIYQLFFVLLRKKQFDCAEALVDYQYFTKNKALLIILYYLYDEINLEDVFEQIIKENIEPSFNLNKLYLKDKMMTEKEIIEKQFSCANNIYKLQNYDQFYKVHRYPNYINGIYSNNTSYNPELKFEGDFDYQNMMKTFVEWQVEDNFYK